MSEVAAGASCRAELAAAGALVNGASELLGIERAAGAAVAAAYERHHAAAVRARLAAMPVVRLREVTAGRLPLAALEGTRFTTVLAVLDASAAELDAVPGVGEQTATHLSAAARQVAKAVAGEPGRVDLGARDPLSRDLLLAVARLEQVQRALGARHADLVAVATDLARWVEAARPMRSRLRYLAAGWFGRPGRRELAREAIGPVRQWLTWAGARGLVEDTARLVADRRLAARTPLDPDLVLADYRRRGARYYTALAQVVDLEPDDVATRGHLPAEIVDRVLGQDLDASFLRGSLRGYQAFGARFALVQRRVVLGDEMGLGKTVQAIAVLCHLAATGVRHALVVCPAGVLVNWSREVAQFSTLPVRLLYGDDREAAHATWVAEGGVGLTTFDGLQRVDPESADGVRLGCLVVDEAHYVKNPAAQRSQAVARWAECAERVLFLTGTPMENRVEEFRRLVEHLDPALAGRLDAADAVAGARAFRRAVGPVYLRRNRSEVLTELPPLTQVDEWVELTSGEGAEYRRAVFDGTFMDLRRAAYLADPVAGAKITRLLEIVTEAADLEDDDAATRGVKVVVFSFFRDVLDVVHLALESLGEVRVFGILSGSSTPVQRQALVDDFQAWEGPAVLVAQIQAGGVGLNLQQASVVVLCEPQVKPSLETQAIGRVYRMGQVRAVQVHRLLVADSVDEHMLRILGTKTVLFDAFVRPSEVAAAAPEAIDISEADLARQVVELERRRLAPLDPSRSHRDRGLPAESAGGPRSG